MKTATIPAVTALIDRYFAIWNETDATHRRSLIAQTWTENACYIDPLLEANDPGGIDTMIASVQAQFPGFRFRQTGIPDVHHDFVRFNWEFGAEDSNAVAGGVDFATIKDGRLQQVIGFLDFVPEENI